MTMNVDGILNPPHNFGADVFKEEVDASDT